MPVNPGYKAFIEELLAPIATITTRSMFGGVGIYGDGLFFALIANEQLYFKVDDTNRPDFEAAGMAPFAPFDDGRTMAYWAVPADVLEDADALAIWTKKAMDVAQRAY